MIRTCDEDDPNLGALRDASVKCGRTFDDVNHWTYCPHAEFPEGPALGTIVCSGDK